jgi:hypothetical protein
MKIRRYVPPVHYSQADQIQMIKDDLLRDAICSEDQAQNGPYYPDKGITKESLLQYAAECRAQIQLDFTPDQFIRGRV